MNKSEKAQEERTESAKKMFKAILADDLTELRRLSMEYLKKNYPMLRMEDLDKT